MFLDWKYSAEHGEPCRVIETHTLWGKEMVRVWLAQRNEVVQLAADRLKPLTASRSPTLDDLTYISAAARILDALERDTLVAPTEGSVIPLPHQLHALERAMSDDRVRFLLADEVGLGKTIEAGLILRELKVRGLVRRVLVVSPAGLVNQWVSEMETHFNEDFRAVHPSNFSAWRQLTGKGKDDNLWQLHDQVVCSMDSVKPMDARQGWSREQLARYNRERFEDLIAAGWDLIVVDEAHRLAGSTEQVARYKLGKELSQASPYLLLLTATPHQGKTDAFRRLVNFLDPDALPDDDSVSEKNVAPYVIRTEKRNAIDAEGNPLFKPRFTQIVTAEWDEKRQEQRALYEAVTDYVREGYNRALQEQNTAIGFLMVLMQRLVTSSTAAIRTALERRLEVLKEAPGQKALFPEDIGDDWVALEGQEQMETLLNRRLRGLQNEQAEVELLLSAARRCEARGPDVKAETLLSWIRKLQQEENDPSLKILIFTEFIPTQSMLAEFLRQRGLTVTCLNGSLSLDERQVVQREFANDAQVLISTDAGGEGLNLQFCHVVVNYDLPWNPMKLEQRIGRVDRIGQKHIVRALNFALDDTVELRVREVLEEKLERILDEFGVDKLSDVLDSEESGIDFEDLYVSAVLAPEDAEARAKAAAERLRERARAAREGSSLLGATKELDPDAAKKVADHQMPYWTERMTLSWLRGRQEMGARVTELDKAGYNLRWPDGAEIQGAAFERSHADGDGLTQLTVENPKIRQLIQRVPTFIPGQPLLAVMIPGISEKVAGYWSLWRVGLQTGGNREQRIVPVFVRDDGQAFEPTARVVWDRLIAQPEGIAVVSSMTVDGASANDVFQMCRTVAEKIGEDLFEELRIQHQQRLDREREKMAASFAARRRAIERIGLPQVRDFRLANLEREQQEWREELHKRETALPELTPLLLIAVASSSAEGATV